MDIVKNKNAQTVQNNNFFAIIKVSRTGCRLKIEAQYIKRFWRNDTFSDFFSQLRISYLKI